MADFVPGAKPVTSAYRPNVATLLAFIWPGLGQLYRGRPKLGLAYAVLPTLLVAGVAVAFQQLGALQFALYLLNPVVSVGLLVVLMLTGVVRVMSIVDASRAGRRLSRATLGLASLLIGVVVLSHVWLGYNLWSFYRTGQAIYDPTPIGVTPTPLPSPNGSGALPTPTPAPPLPGVDRRVTILFIGVDNTHGVDRGLTDSLIVASFDPQAGTTVMISLPRDTARLPYYGGGIWPSRINSLMQAATRRPDEFPDGPLPTLVNEMSYIVGIPIDYYARIDIGGFTQLIDLVGGVDVDLANEINDPTYQFTPTERGFHLLPGPHHLDGKLATAYARSRHGSGNSDFQRARRQQQILLALRDKADDPGVLANLPAVLDVVSQIVRTNAPLDRLPEIVSVVQNSTGAETRNVVLAPPRYAESIISASGERTFAYQLRMDAVAALSIELFGEQSRYAVSPSP